MIFKILHVPDSSLPKFTNKVERNFYVSRLALFECLKELNPREFANKDFNTALKENILQIVAHHTLKEFPEFLVSISHTTGIGAATIAPKSQLLGLGIDIELASRKITPKIREKFINDEDDPNTTYDSLRSWCMKEAAFKALEPISEQFFNKKPLVLSDIWLKNETFGPIGRKDPIGKIDTFLQCVKKTDVVSSLAYIEVR